MCSSLEIGQDTDEYEGKVMLCGYLRVPKDKHLPSQEVINATSVAIGIEKQYRYSVAQFNSLALRYFKEVKRRMNRGQTLQYLVSHHARICYDVHKR